MRDYLNRERKRNRDNTNLCSYNCGGFALGTYSWYLPYYDFDAREDQVEDLISRGFNEEQIYRKITSLDVNQILSDFKNNLRVIEKEEDLLVDETLVAYRFFVDFNYYNGVLHYEDSDFHFRVKLNDTWFEKNGDEPITEVEDMDLIEPWCAQCGDYDSNTILFALKN